ncbi:MAG: alkyldihydroxyacetonephosphate synthase [Actinomycetota bacterium]|nr:alkyldihydroxyacetonephosphate synthase [Actinomycetota bacterium]
MSAAEELAGLLGAHRVSSDPNDLDHHSHDWSPAALQKKRAGEALRRPTCVVRPVNTEQVATILRWAHETRTSIVPFGGGSSVVRGIEPADCVVVDLQAMENILHFDTKSRLVTAQAGVWGPDLVRSLGAWGFTLGHEPQSIRLSTVGGWLATRSAGQLSARYGAIEDMVAGLEAVVPGGRIVRSKPMPRRSVGPDIAGLMIGSEGTLGIITEATLRVHPISHVRADRCVTFDHMADGVTAARTIAQSDLGPTLVRLYDKEDSMLFGMSIDGFEPRPLLLLSFEGFDADTRADRALGACGGRAGDPKLVEHWWEHRNDAVETFRGAMDGVGPLGPHGVADTIELSATWSDLRDLYHAVKDALSERAQLCGCHLSHVYVDGACLYFTLASTCDDEHSAARTLEGWWETAMEVCLAHGGSISHHHGIGRTKARWLPTELGEWWHVLVAVKQAVDPLGIMNPGAMGL